MKSPKTNKRKGFLGFLKKARECIWNSDKSLQDCSNKAKSAQELRDEYQKKCPWKGDLW